MLSGFPSLLPYLTLNAALFDEAVLAIGLKKTKMNFATPVSSFQGLYVAENGCLRREAFLAVEPNAVTIRMIRDYAMSRLQQLAKDGASVDSSAKQKAYCRVTDTLMPPNLVTSGPVSLYAS